MTISLVIFIFFTILLAVFCVTGLVVHTQEMRKMAETIVGLQRNLSYLEEAFKCKPSEEYHATMQRRFDEAVNREHKHFEKELEKAYQNACGQIKFDEIKYKKTITTKRKNFVRKNKPDDDSIKIWRDIYDE